MENAVIRKLLAPVLTNVPLTAPGHYVMTFEAPDMARDALPGHFVAVYAETGLQILRRPFSFYTADSETGNCSILYSVYGPTTRKMSEMQPGDNIDLIGPLGGRVFAADERPGVHHIMVGGGYGVPPLAFLSQRILAVDPNARVSLVVGARNSTLLVGTEGMEEFGVAVRCCTNDGSFGFPGMVTGLLEQMLLEDAGTPVHIYTCGPTPMMHAVSDMAIAFDVPCQVTMEPFMPCGIGICMGCAVSRQDGSFARGCVDGPVFEAREVVW
jgi:dihydroorotate dehydrogenase electron transfer subunit